MRILITGFIALVIWSFLSMWLYVDILKPAAKKQAVVQPVQETLNREADSLAKLYASMPEELKITFEFDKSTLIVATESESRIAEFKIWLDKYPGSMITITGHTDFIGTPEYNIRLGQERAEIVKNYLAGKGIPADRMITTSMGEDQPVADHITAAGRALNRRTEVTIKK
jgi:outer membrane protein OmpA-like peptidoglycan-associated protein